MLTQLRIRDFALIREIDLEFAPSFNVLTGETGAGKSILIDAVSLLLGARSSGKDVRTGAKRAVVEGIFSLSEDAAVRPLLEELGCAPDEEGTLILLREVSSGGKSLCRVNERTVTLAAFRRIGQSLVNIYGQRDFQSISDPERHLELLDSLGGEAFQRQKAELAQLYRRMSERERERDALRDSLQERQMRLDFLHFKLRELEELDLRPGEEAELEQELSVLDNYEKIAGATEKAAQYLYGDRRSVYALLAAAVDGLQAVEQYDRTLAEIGESLRNMLYLAEDHGIALSGYSRRIDYDPERLERLSERKYALDRIKRKYHLTVEELLAEQARLREEADHLEHADEEIAVLEEDCAALRQQYETLALALRTARRQLASQLTEGLLSQLAELAMTHTRFAVQFTERAASVQGMDRVEFFLSANPGQPLRPLSQIASGGEMSRIMLAFKTVLAQQEKLDTLIFDEIDAGIGGNVVVKVGEKLSDVSRHAQVICITHAPQIAALADRHVRIRKTVDGEQTTTSVAVLDETEQIAELARMLGGEEEFQLRHARELKRLAAERKRAAEESGGSVQ